LGDERTGFRRWQDEKVTLQSSPAAHAATREERHVPHGTAQRRALWIALVANGVFMVAEIAGGIVFSSLALLADAAHMGTDVAGLAIALGAQWLVDRPASVRHSYGFRRAEVLGALLNGLLLIGAAGWVLLEAARRLGDPAEVGGGGVIVVASLGLLINLVSAAVIARAAGRSLNLRGAWLHMMADAAGSVGAIVAGVAIVLWNARWADPVVSVAISVLVVWAGWKLLSETVTVLLEGAPRGLDVGGVEGAIENLSDVDDVHHLHLWNISSDMPALSAHVVLAGEVSLHEAQVSGDRIKALLAERFGIEHATLELECHACEPGAGSDPEGQHDAPGHGLRSGIS